MAYFWNEFQKNYLCIRFTVYVTGHVHPVLYIATVLSVINFTSRQKTLVFQVNCSISPSAFAFIFFMVSLRVQHTVLIVSICSGYQETDIRLSQTRVASSNKNRANYLYEIIYSYKRNVMYNDPGKYNYIYLVLCDIYFWPFCKITWDIVTIAPSLWRPRRDHVCDQRRT